MNFTGYGPGLNFGRAKPQNYHPRIKRESGEWVCAGAWRGPSPRAAYDSWYSYVLRYYDFRNEAVEWVRHLRERP